MAAAYCDGSEEGKLRHRYEMAIDRSLRATIGQLMMLEKSGADLAGAESHPDDAQEDTSEDPASAEAPAAGAGFGRRDGARVNPDPARGPNRRPGGPGHGAAAGRRGPIAPLTSTFVSINRVTRGRAAPRCAPGRHGRSATLT